MYNYIGIFIVICYMYFFSCPLQFFFLFFCFFSLWLLPKRQCLQNPFFPLGNDFEDCTEILTFCVISFFNVDCSLHNFIFLIKKCIIVENLEAHLYITQKQNHLHSHYIWSWSQQLFQHIYFKNMNNLKVDYMVYELLFCYLTIL